jgi:hypothetical protein
MIDAYYIPVEKIKEIEWEGDSKAYDLALYKLGEEFDEFIIANPDYEGHHFYKNIKSLPLTDSNRCVVWKYNGVWIAKYFKREWINEQRYWEVDLNLFWEKNPDIDITFNTPDIKDLYDLNYNMTWYIDPKFSNDDKIWIMKCHLRNIETLGEKDMGCITPDIHIRQIYNPDIPDIEYENNFNLTYQDFGYECTWYLDPKYNPDKDKIWAVKSKLRGASNKPTKDMGYVSPKITYNPDLPNLEINISDHISYYELVYEHVWMLDTTVADNVWAAKIIPKKSKGVKTVGIAHINLPKQLDVVFISYNEPNAEENWRRVLEKSPKAFRINGIKGIVNAHKCAAELATTDMFYVVDGDAYLTDEWSFEFQPGIFDRDCVHVWRSRNPINGLEYGYGGVKLLPKQLTLDVDPMCVDMTTSISSKFKTMNKISNITAFNTDEFNTFRSAFRECAKLSSNILKRQLSRESEKRLDIWCSSGRDKPHGEWAIKGAITGRKFGKKNAGNHVKLALINDISWIQLMFNQELT